MIPDDDIQAIRTRPGNDEDVVRLIAERELFVGLADAVEAARPLLYSSDPDDPEYDRRFLKVVDALRAVEQFQ